MKRICFEIYVLIFQKTILQEVFFHSEFVSLNKNFLKREN